MDEAIRYAIQVVVVAMMTLVGTDCTLTGVRDSMRCPWLMITVLLGQFFIVPVLMYGCCYMLGISVTVTAGLMLIACCPAGAISNTYCYLMKGNTSLSVILTVTSNLAAMVATPVALISVRGMIGPQSSGIPLIPVAPMMRELGLMMILPIVIGSGIRAKIPMWILMRQRVLRKLALASITALILLIVGSDPTSIVRHFQEIALVTVLFTIVLFVPGWLISLAFKLPINDRWAVLFEFPCRNLAIAAVLGIAVLNRPELVRFAAILFLIQTALLLVLMSVIVKR